MTVEMPVGELVRLALDGVSPALPAWVLTSLWARHQIEGVVLHPDADSRVLRKLADEFAVDADHPNVDAAADDARWFRPLVDHPNADPDTLEVIAGHVRTRGGSSAMQAREELPDHVVAWLALTATDHGDPTGVGTLSRIDGLPDPPAGQSWDESVRVRWSEVVELHRRKRAAVPSLPDWVAPTLSPAAGLGGGRRLLTADEPDEPVARSVPRDEWSQWAAHREPLRRAAAAASSDDPDMVARLASDGRQEVRCEAVANPVCPTEVWMSHVEQAKPFESVGLITRNDLPSDQIGRLVTAAVLRFRRARVIDHGWEPDVLTEVVRARCATLRGRTLWRVGFGATLWDDEPDT